jgi:glycosyltransferase involved in cell wall biosynthesis
MKILFVAYPDSLHTQRWIRQLPEKWNIHLWYSTHRMSPGARDVARGKQRELPKVVFHESEGRNESEDGEALAAAVARVKPDVIHSLLIPENGFYTLLAKRKSVRFPAWIASDWGNDLSLFGRIPEIRKRNSHVLASCDYYWSECRRDVALATKLGFRGKSFPSVPVAGGFDLSTHWKHPVEKPSKRRWILIKGYQDTRGRALVALRAVDLCRELLRDFKIGIYGALVEPLSPALSLEIRKLRMKAGLDVRLLPQVDHKRQIQRHGKSRVSIGLSMGDGISTSLLEAMMMGSFPIQSDTACCCEWIRHAKTGMIVPPENPEAVAQALREALIDDELVDQAFLKNRVVARERLDFKKTAQLVQECYSLARGEKETLSRESSVHL